MSRALLEAIFIRMRDEYSDGRYYVDYPEGGDCIRIKCETFYKKVYLHVKMSEDGTLVACFTRGEKDAYFWHHDLTCDLNSPDVDPKKFSVELSKKVREYTKTSFVEKLKILFCFFDVESSMIPFAKI